MYFLFCETKSISKSRQFIFLVFFVVGGKKQTNKEQTKQREGMYYLLRPVAAQTPIPVLRTDVGKSSDVSTSIEFQAATVKH